MIGMSLVSTAALASDSPQRIVEVQGREYAAFVEEFGDPIWSGEAPFSLEYQNWKLEADAALCA